MAQFDAVLFDVDGTLIHSSPGILATMEYTFRAMGLDPSKVDLNRYLGPPLRRSFGEHFQDSAMVEKMVDIYRTQYEQEGCHQCQVYPGVVEMLTTLKEAGIRLYTATSKPTVVVEPILEEQGLASFFDFIGGASQDSSVDTKTAVMEQVLARPELQNARILMVGDRKDDMKGAADCAVPAAGVLYGYAGRQELEPFQPIFLAEDCQALTQFILQD